MTENTVADIGALLKARREKLGYSLNDAAQHTRIRKTHLDSIESNRFSDLPGKVYITGFIRVYARYLDLDSDALLAQLEDLPEETSRLTINAAPLRAQPARRSRKPAAMSFWSFFLLGFLAVVLLGAAVYFLPGLFRAPEPVRQTMPAAVPEPQPAPQEMAPSVQEQQPVLPPTEAEQKPTATGQEAGVPAQEPGTPAAVETVPPQSNALPPIPAVGASLRMLAMADSSLIIYLDDRPPHEYKLYNGLDLIWKVKKNAMIELGVAGAARFWLDGEELDLGTLESFKLNQVTGE